ncbi:KxYKxGKxW signal peptide domain-containing protein [Fructobacillus fructosus]|uniref:KxYKxGKxW signal peptide domain-containing protein n=1 Tax=Fructobacillus fructosus TaxID=1631 RepID=UPI0040338A89
MPTQTINIKEHYKMYKSGKRWLYASLAAVLMSGGVALSQSAYADEVSSTTTTQTQNQAQPATSSTQKNADTTTNQAPSASVNTTSNSESTPKVTEKTSGDVTKISVDDTKLNQAVTDAKNEGVKVTQDPTQKLNGKLSDEDDLIQQVADDYNKQTNVLNAATAETKQYKSNVANAEKSNQDVQDAAKAAKDAGVDVHDVSGYSKAYLTTDTLMGYKDGIYSALFTQAGRDGVFPGGVSDNRVSVLFDATGNHFKYTFIPLRTSDGGNTVTPSGQTNFAEGAVYSTPDFGKVPVVPTKPTLTLVDEPKKPDALKASYHLYDMPKHEATPVSYHKDVIAIDQTPKPSVTNNTINNYSYTTNNYPQQPVQPQPIAAPVNVVQTESPTLPETGKAASDSNEGITAAAVLAAGTATMFMAMKRRKLI